jgi:FixJ family two-component response regulator
MIVQPNKEAPIIAVIDDDEDVRQGLTGLLQSVGLRAELFASVREFLDSGRLDRFGCLVLDVRLPGKSGLDFHDDLVKAKVHLPVVFISGHADVPMSVRAMKAGAVEFLTKPFRHQDLLDAIQSAIEQDSARRKSEDSITALRVRFDRMTIREQEVMQLAAAGRMNKHIAEELGISLPTVKLHRGHAMRKMGARSLADLVRMADKLDLVRR